jgi:hypothetical protein
MYLYFVYHVIILRGYQSQVPSEVSTSQWIHTDLLIFEKE